MATGHHCITVILKCVQDSRGWLEVQTFPPKIQNDMKLILGKIFIGNVNNEFPILLLMAFSMWMRAAMMVLMGTVTKRGYCNCGLCKNCITWRLEPFSPFVGPPLKRLKHTHFLKGNTEALSLFGACSDNGSFHTPPALSNCIFITFYLKLIGLSYYVGYMPEGKKKLKIRE